MKVEELPEEKVESIRVALAGPYNTVAGSSWLRVHPCTADVVFSNPILLDKAVAAAIVASGVIAIGAPAETTVYACDIVRKDGEIFDIDRHLLEPSGNTILKKNQIEKGFPEHHSSEIPKYYLSK